MPIDKMTSLHIIPSALLKIRDLRASDLQYGANAAVKNRLRLWLLNRLHAY